MGYGYIGSKTKIADEIVSEIQKIAPEGETVCDLMCGTGSISLELRKKGYKVISADVMNQACHITKVKVLLRQSPLFRNIKKENKAKGQMLLAEQSGCEAVIQTLNSLSPKKGYFWKEFSPEGKPENGEEPRRYFSADNAKKIDASREFIKNLKQKNMISEIEHSLLIHDLVVSANDAANIAGTYGHYLSKFASRALQPLKFHPAKFERGGKFTNHKIINGHAEKTVKK